VVGGGGGGGGNNKNLNGFSILGYVAILTANQLPMFRRNLLSPSSRQPKLLSLCYLEGGSRLRRNVDKQLQINVTS
jgi:hypothetical protein